MPKPAPYLIEDKPKGPPAPTDQKFWLVWRVTGKRPPLHPHATREAAEGEAERLARKFPGITFAILEAIGTRQVDDMRRVDFGPRETVYGVVSPFAFGFDDGPDLIGGKRVPVNPSPSCPLCDPDPVLDDVPF